MIRNHLGQVTSSASDVIMDCASAETAESLAYQEGPKNSSARSSRLNSRNHPNTPPPLTLITTHEPRGGHRRVLRGRRRRREPAQAPRPAGAPSAVRAIGRSAARGGASAMPSADLKKASLLRHWEARVSSCRQRREAEMRTMRMEEWGIRRGECCFVPHGEVT
jgi:hypothetical protein